MKLLGKKSQSYSSLNMKFYTAQSTGTRIHTPQPPKAAGGTRQRQQDSHALSLCESSSFCLHSFPQCSVGEIKLLLHLFNSEVIDEVMVMFIQAAVQCDAIAVH